MKKDGRRLSDVVEEELLKRIISGVYPVEGELPLERELAAELGVGRPTLREAIQRLERDGWLSVRKGQHTKVNDYWRTGNMNIIATLARQPDLLGDDFIQYVLELRVAVTPFYVKSAVRQSPPRVVAALVNHDRLDDQAEAFARFDWELQKNLARIAPNPVYTLMLNSFDEVYLSAATEYFADEVNRENSRRFYRRLIEAAMSANPQLAEEVALEAMNTAAENWQESRRQIQQAVGEAKRG